MEKSILLVLMLCCGLTLNAQTSNVERARKFAENGEYGKAITLYSRMLKHDSTFAKEAWPIYRDGASFEESFRLFEYMSNDSTNGQGFLINAYAYLMRYDQRDLMDSVRQLMHQSDTRALNKSFFKNNGSIVINPIAGNTEGNDLITFRIPEGVYFRKGVSEFKPNTDSIKVQFLDLNASSKNRTLNKQVFENEILKSIAGQTKIGGVIWEKNSDRYFWFEPQTKHNPASIYLRFSLLSQKPFLPSDFPFNKKGYEIISCTFSEEDSTLVFSGNEIGGLGGYDLYSSKINDQGDWSTPLNLGVNINTVGDEVSPILVGNNLFYSSNGLPGQGGMDVFVVNLNDATKSPQPIGGGINSPFDEFNFVPNQKLDQGFFNTNRNSQMGYDIYSYSIPRNSYAFALESIETMPKIVALELGYEPNVVTLPKIRNNYAAEYEIPSNIETACISLNESNVDQLYTWIETTEEPIAIQYAQSYFLITESDYYPRKRAIDDLKEWVISESPTNLKWCLLGEKLADTQSEEEKSFKTHSIYFQYSESELEKEDELDLEKYIENQLKKRPDLKFLIEGHADCIGTKINNNKVASFRANSVHKFLTERFPNIAFEVVVTEQSAPIFDYQTNCKNPDKSLLQLERRVQITPESVDLFFERKQKTEVYFKLNQSNIQPDDILEILTFLRPYASSLSPSIIKLSAYADCIGTDAYNLVLARKRALEVQGLIEKVLPGTTITFGEISQYKSFEGITCALENEELLKKQRKAEIEVKTKN